MTNFDVVRLVYMVLLIHLFWLNVKQARKNIQLVPRGPFFTVNGDKRKSAFLQENEPQSKTDAMNSVRLYAMGSCKVFVIMLINTNFLCAEGSFHHLVGTLSSL